MLTLENKFPSGSIVVAHDSLAISRIVYYMYDMELSKREDHYVICQIASRP